MEALVGGHGVTFAGFVYSNLGLGNFVLRLVRPGIDFEQEVVLLDERAFLERHLDQIAGDARDDVHRVDRVSAASEVDVVNDLALDRLTDRHRWWLSRGDLRLTLRTADNSSWQDQAKQESILFTRFHDRPPFVSGFSTRPTWTCLSAIFVPRSICEP